MRLLLIAFVLGTLAQPALALPECAQLKGVAAKQVRSAFQIKSDAQPTYPVNKEFMKLYEEYLESASKVATIYLAFFKD